MSGEPIPLGDLPGWRQIFTDDFATDVPLGSFPGMVGSFWTAYPTSFDDTSNNGRYDPGRTISCAQSVMRIRMHTSASVDQYGSRPRVAAPIPLIAAPSSTVKWPGQLYGRYAVRARIPAPIPGYKIAWLLWPDVGTNTTGATGGGGNGEIDWPETDLVSLDAVSGFMHRQNATAQNDQYATGRRPCDLRQWHTFGLEWSPNLCRFLLDGVEVGRTADRVPNTAMHWVLQCETQVTSTIPAPATQGDIEVDWVAVWAYAP